MQENISTFLNPSDSEIKDARHQLWEMGCLEWKLDASQLDIYNFFHGKKDKIIVVNASRRLGKTFALVIMAFEQCLQKERSVVKLIQPEVKMIRTNVRPIIDEILVDCPMHLAPVYNSQDNIYRFPNGSQIQLAGTDNGNYMKIRGGNGHLIIIDEAGFCSDLQHMINYVLIPTTTLTKGRIILSSTTPPQPDHEFNEYMDVAEVEGRFIRKTIYDALEDNKGVANPRITREIIEEIIQSIPGRENSDAFRTEYLCERITNSDDSVVAEFTKEVQEQVVTEWHRPAFCDKYVSMDIGFKDLTVILFGYYDFEHAVLVIEDEIVLKGSQVNAPNVTKLIREKEAFLWTNKYTTEVESPYMRVSDNNLIFLNDLRMPPNNMPFIATEKHNKDAYINQMKVMVADRRIIIHPRCKTLILHLTNATWDKTRKDYKRSADGGHYDGVDALAYLVRNLNQSHNPFPPGYSLRHMKQSNAHFMNPQALNGQSNSQFKQLDNMFKAKSSFRKK